MGNMTLEFKGFQLQNCVGPLTGKSSNRSSSPWQGESGKELEALGSLAGRGCDTLLPSWGRQASKPPHPSRLGRTAPAPQSR